MSDEHKPHGDDHHADDHHGGDHHDAPAAAAHPEPAHDAAPEAHPEPHHEAPAEPPHHADDVTGHAPEPDHAHADAGDHDHAHAEPAHEPEPEASPIVEAPLAVAAAVGAAAAAATAAVAQPAASSSDRPVIWSDRGDAPFEETPDEGPVYARRSGGKAKKPKKKSSGGSEFAEIVKTIVFALLIAMVLRIFLFQPFTIPSASMEPNLYEGDYIVVTKWSYGYSRHSMPFSPEIFEGRILNRAPERGDIAVFKLPRDNRTDYIKRVIGLPGDRIQMINNRLFINGTQVPDIELTDVQIRGIETEAAAIRLRETLPNGRSFIIQDYGPHNLLDNTPPIEVPAGHYFMMGDNRDNSIDSRVLDGTGVGFVPEENLIGKAEIILFSWSPGASLANPVSWFANLRPSRFFTVLE